ncbi:hypothetical protein PBY51_024235 [Eleginops maclovinus]|uniref:Sushi domain-containing protein n=1 Tax=Eleginops maclovinus TaxID=56733 RepID=A0AAN7XZ86_ELEMC|nr:hypothetical protein PBY51_024235 [Eleginops maclovinus]
MHSLTYVKSQDCTLQQFLNGPLYDQNFDTSGMADSYSGGRQVRVGCNVGFNGFFKLTCVEGKWDSKGTICKPKSCGHPGDSPSADFHLEKGDDFVFGSQVKYTCHKGYQMVSRINYRRCMAEGWDGNVPVCEAQQCPLINVDSNVLVNGDIEEATFGNVVRFSCKFNSEVMIGPTEIYCDENGEWEGQVPKCKEIKCIAPEIENGDVLGEIQEYKEDQVLEFRCKPSFIRAEARDSKCTKQGVRAEWSPTPLCEPIKCKLQLPALKGTRPICQEVTCSKRGVPDVTSWNSWMETFKLGETEGYRCKRGYKSKDGTNRAKCTRDGWQPNPLCQVKTCIRKVYDNADIDGLSLNEYEYTEQVRYICNKGYEGRFIITCGEDGWRGYSQCREAERQCKTPTIDYADIIGVAKETYRQNERIRYACKNNVERLFTVTCKENGWTGIESCSACSNVIVPHGFFVGPYNDTLYYSCEDGYKFPTKAWWAEAKCNDSVSPELKQCIENTKCGELPVIPNGELIESRRQGESTQVNCKAGYRTDVRSFTCRDGKWHSNGIPLKKICTPIATPCSPPPKVENAVVLTPYQKEYLSDSEVTYKCRESYTAKGETTIQCRDGQWEEKNMECTPPTQKQ